MRYLVAHSHGDDHDLERLQAIRAGVEAWLQEQARVAAHCEFVGAALTAPARS